MHICEYANMYLEYTEIRFCSYLRLATDWWPVNGAKGGWWHPQRPENPVST